MSHYIVYVLVGISPNYNVGIFVVRVSMLREHKLISGGVTIVTVNSMAVAEFQQQWYMQNDLSIFSETCSVDVVRDAYIGLNISSPSTEGVCRRPSWVFCALLGLVDGCGSTQAGVRIVQQLNKRSG